MQTAESQLVTNSLGVLSTQGLFQPNFQNLGVDSNRMSSTSQVAPNTPRNTKNSFSPVADLPTLVDLDSDSDYNFDTLKVYAVAQSTMAQNTMVQKN